MKILFFGTPQVAVPFLSRLIDQETVVGVVCQPDRPAGRGYELAAPPVKAAAEVKGIPVFQPQGKWTVEILETFQKFDADLGIAVAYGRILPETIFSAPRLGSINIHFSLLPKYRGAGPIQWALMNGETETGVSAFWLDPGMDTGPIFHQKKVPIEPADNAATLREKLIPAGLEILGAVLSDSKRGTIVKSPQVGEPSFAPLLKKEDGRIDWRKSSAAIVNLIRGTYEWPGAAAFYEGPGSVKKQLKVFLAESRPTSPKKKPGTIIEAAKESGILVQSGDGSIRLLQVQPEGKTRMPAWDFWKGARMNIGDIFL